MWCRANVAEAGTAFGAGRAVEPAARIVVCAKIANGGFVAGVAFAGAGLSRSAIGTAEGHAAHDTESGADPLSPCASG